MTTTKEIIELEKKYVVQTYLRPEFVFELGEGIWLVDTEGNEYLDACSGIAVNALGYRNDVIINTIREGAEGLLHVSNLYHTAPQALLARDLCEASFADRVFFCNSGTEANEGALKFARKFARVNGHTDKTKVVAFTGSFHGRTMGALACTATEKYRKPFEPLMGDVSFAEYNNLDSAFQAITKQTCAVIVEPVQGEGGVTPARSEFLIGVRDLCNEVDALLIFDEVQCGMGRAGSLWAHEDYGVFPDIMTLAKPLAGGLPMGAILLTETVAGVIQHGDHASTFAGGPLISTVARAVFSRISDPEFLVAVKLRSSYLETELNKLVARTPLITGVRGKGMMWGLLSAIPAAEIVAEARNHGLIILVAGEKVVRLLPPLIINEQEIDLLVERLEATLESVR